MTLKKGQRRRDQQDMPFGQGPLPPDDNRLAFWVALLTLILSAGTVFLVHRMTGDTFMTIAGGQDVVDGKLGGPDDWSFIQHDQVWINTNWGTGLLFYGMYQLFGYFGIVILKGIMVGLLCVFLYLAARRMGVNASTAMLTAAYINYTLISFVDLRPNLVGLTFMSAMVWMLYWSSGRPHRIWAVAALLLAWTHMHGTFMFGIAMLGLWTVVYYIYASFQPGRSRNFKALWPLPVATVVAIVLAGVTSPFGMENLTLPFSYIGLFQEEPWPMGATEMLPIFSDSPNAVAFAGSLWYLFTLGCLVAPFSLRAVEHLAGSRSEGKKYSTDFAVMRTFTVVLTVITIVMAFKTRRFMPLSLITASPLLAYEYQRLLIRPRMAWIAGLTVLAGALLARPIAWVLMQMQDSAGGGGTPWDRRHVWAITALVLALSPLLGMVVVGIGRPVWAKLVERVPAVASGIAWLGDSKRLPWASLILAAGVLWVISGMLPRELSYYSDDSPWGPKYDMFGNMVMMQRFPDGAVDFIELNDLKGNALNKRNWEGYIRLCRPEVKIMAGGRSRQAYSREAAKKYITAKMTKDDAYHTQLGISLLIDDASPSFYGSTAARTVVNRNTPWRIIYCDGRVIVAANKDLPESRHVLFDYEMGRLKYPTTLSEKCTRATRVMAFSTTGSSDEILQACREATAERPIFFLYRLLGLQMDRYRVDLNAAAEFIHSELVRLHPMEYRKPNGLELLQCRSYLARLMVQWYSQRQSAQAEFWKEYTDNVDATRQALSQCTTPPPALEIPAEYRQFGQ